MQDTIAPKLLVLPSSAAGPTDDCEPGGGLKHRAHALLKVIPFWYDVAGGRRLQEHWTAPAFQLELHAAGAGFM